MLVYLKAVGIIAPGIDNWVHAVQIFSHLQAYENKPVRKKLASILPPNERRRATRVTQLAMAAALQTSTDEQQNDLSQCLQVFSSSNGDISTFDHISRALAIEGRPVSPTRFHNSVHNAPAGYWSIASQSRTASTSITAYTDSFAAGLLEAAVQLNAADNHRQRDCLLVAYDESPPTAFKPAININGECAIALKLSLHSDDALAAMKLSIAASPQSIEQLKDKQLEQLRQSNPQAAALPLLQAIVQKNEKAIVLPYFESGLIAELTNINPGNY